MDYGIGVSNRYAFLEQDVEDNPVIEVAKKSEDVKVNDAKKPSKKTEQSTVHGKRMQGANTGLSKKEGTGHADAQRDQSRAQDGNGFEMNTRGRGRGGSSGTGRGRGTEGGRTDASEYSRDKENQNGFGSGTSTRGSRGRGGGREEGRGRGGFARRTRDYNDESEEPYDESRGANDYDGQQRSGNVEFSGRGRGSRGGSAAGRGGFTRKREFDRHSGSDKGSIKPVDKRDGGGARNWGNYKDEIEGVADNGNEIENFEEKTVEVGQGDVEGEIDPTLPVDEEKNGNEVTVEQEPKTMTLEEWKAQQQPRSVPAFNIRKPNEGVDPSQWKNLVLKKSEKIQDDDDEYEEEDILFLQRAGRQKRITDIGFHFGETRDGDRGFRGRFRGGRGNNRGGQSYRKQERDGNYAPVLQVDDVNDFPTLGSVGQSLVY